MSNVGLHDMFSNEKKEVRGERVSNISMESGCQWTARPRGARGSCYSERSGCFWCGGRERVGIKAQYRGGQFK